MNYRFHRAALAEHLGEVAFYEDRLPGLGADYLVEFEKVMTRVCATPELYPRVADLVVRKAQLERFPFQVIYHVAQAQVFIVAIAHQRRRPAYWVGRIGK